MGAIRRGALSGAGMIVALGAAGVLAPHWSTVRAARPSEAVESQQVELFTALKAKDISVKFVPTNEAKAHLRVTNNSPRPLSVELPRAFAGAPVVAQRGLPLPPLGGPQNNGQGQPPQVVGAVPRQQNGPQFPLPGNFFMMNIPPGKTQEVPLVCVCLEYGKPTPSSDIPYRAVALDEVAGGDEVRIVLEDLADGVLTQRVAQLLAWHFQNKLSFTEMANTGAGSRVQLNEARAAADRIRRQAAARAVPSAGQSRSPSSPER